MRSEKQMIASRINGQKSRGPVTAMGKDRIRSNALKHGLTARMACWKNEDPEQFQRLLVALLEQFAPTNDVEFLCIEEMAMAKWRLRRVVSLETAAGNFHLQQESEKNAKKEPQGWPMGLEEPEEDAEPVVREPAERSLEAFLSAQDDGQLLTTLRQHEASYARAYQRAYRHLNELRADRAAAVNVADPRGA